jgi:ADP-ribose pyrophosphatase YjhB (NUDIX family)
MPFPPLNFCSNCGAKVGLRVPPGDSLPRYVCDNCGTIHYRNPLLVVGTIPEWKDQVLLCKRAIEPRSGLWTLPAGFMELDETTAQAALRETYEEAKARVELGEAFTLLSVPHVNQVHLFYRARLLDGGFAPGEETLEVALFREHEIPWREIAFRTISTTLQHFYADRKEGPYRVHVGEILPPR